MTWWMKSRDAALMAGRNQRRIGSMMRLVCSEEKESVESTNIIAAQSSAGHQARSQAGNSERGGMREPRPASSGTGRGLPQDSEVDKSCSSKRSKLRPQLLYKKYACRKSIDKQPQNSLFHTIVGRFFRNNYIVDMALAKAGSGDAGESSLFRELRDGARAHVAHATFEPADQLIG